MKILNNLEIEKALHVRNTLYDINFSTQEVSINKKLPYEEKFYFSDIYQVDFYELVLKLNFSKCCAPYYLSTILEDDDMYQFSLDSELDEDDYFNLMFSPMEIGLKVPDVGLCITEEQIFIYSLDAFWYIYANRAIDKTILYSENPIIVNSFWKGRGIEDGSAPDFE